MPLHSLWSRHLIITDTEEDMSLEQHCTSTTLQHYHSKKSAQDMGFSPGSCSRMDAEPHVPSWSFPLTVGRILTPGLASSTAGWDRSPRAYSPPGEVEPAGERTITPVNRRGGFLMAWRAGRDNEKKKWDSITPSWTVPRELPLTSS